MRLVLLLGVLVGCSSATPTPTPPPTPTPSPTPAEGHLEVGDPIVLGQPPHLPWGVAIPGFAWSGDHGLIVTRDSDVVTARRIDGSGATVGTPIALSTSVAPFSSASVLGVSSGGWAVVGGGGPAVSVAWVSDSGTVVQHDHVLGQNRNSSWRMYLPVEIQGGLALFGQVCGNGDIPPCSIRRYVLGRDGSTTGGELFSDSNSPPMGVRVAFGPNGGALVRPSRVKSTELEITDLDSSATPLGSPHALDIGLPASFVVDAVARGDDRAIIIQKPNFDRFLVVLHPDGSSASTQVGWTASQKLFAMPSGYTIVNVTGQADQGSIETFGANASSTGAQAVAAPHPSCRINASTSDGVGVRLTSDCLEYTSESVDFWASSWSEPNAKSWQKFWTLPWPVRANVGVVRVVACPLGGLVDLVWQGMGISEYDRILTLDPGASATPNNDVSLQTLPISALDPIPTGFFSARDARFLAVDGSAHASIDLPADVPHLIGGSWTGTEVVAMGSNAKMKLVLARVPFVNDSATSVVTSTQEFLDAPLYPLRGAVVLPDEDGTVLAYASGIGRRFGADLGSIDPAAVELGKVQRENGMFVDGPAILSWWACGPSCWVALRDSNELVRIDADSGLLRSSVLESFEDVRAAGGNRGGIVATLSTTGGDAIVVTQYTKRGDPTDATTTLALRPARAGFPLVKPDGALRWRLVRVTDELFWLVYVDADDNHDMQVVVRPITLK